MAMTDVGELVGRLWLIKYLAGFAPTMFDAAGLNNDPGQNEAGDSCWHLLAAPGKLREDVATITISGCPQWKADVKTATME